MATTIWIVCIVVLATNVVVSIKLLLSASYLAIQKILQLVIVWVLPVLGAFLVWHFLREDAKKSKWDAVNVSGCETTDDLVDAGIDAINRVETESSNIVGGVSGGGDGGGE